MVSIIIPCYNNGNYLVKMIDSFRRQTSDDWELIVVDDGSTDDTPQVVEDAFSDLPNAYFYRRDRQPKGSVVCRNIGFEHAKGQYVCHLDADDLVSDTFVEKRQAFMESHPEVDYASFPAMCFTDESKLPVFNPNEFMFGVDKGYSDILESFLRYDYSFSTWNKIYKRKSISDLQWDEKVKIYTDFSFIVPCIIKGLRHSFSGQKEVDYFYRVNHSSIAMTASFVSDEKNRSTIYLFSKTLDSLSRREDYDIRKKQFLGFIYAHFERLLFSCNSDNIERYVDMMRNYYGRGIIFRYKLVASLCKLTGYKKWPLYVFATISGITTKYVEQTKLTLSRKIKL